MEEFEVNVTYRDEKLNPVYEKSYTLEQYTEMLKTDLMRLVTDVEELCYEANDNRPKEEWSDITWDAFRKIKHKLLDKAGDIGRLPKNIKRRSENSLTDFVARVLSKEG